MKPIKLHWASSKPNFGDWLSPKIVEVVSGRPVQFTTIDKCDLVALGSLLQRVKYRFWARRLHIWGAGFIETGKQVHCRHHVHAVRGPLSQARLGLYEDSVALGDPGLLAGLLLDGLTIGKRHRLAIIAHYKDKESATFKALCQANPDAKVLDVFSDPLSLLKDIAASHYVLSSAMHGLIAADALGVPNARVVLGDQVRGGDFKFNDYYKALSVSEDRFMVQPLTDAMLEAQSEAYRRPGLALIKENLIAAFPSL